MAESKPAAMQKITPYEKVSGKRGVRVEVRGEFADMLTMRNGYQWSGMPIDRELLEMVREAVEFALAASPAVSAQMGEAAKQPKQPDSVHSAAPCGDGASRAPLLASSATDRSELPVRPSPRGTDAQILKERELTISAINGAMAFGYQGVNPPPNDPRSDWLTPFWALGRKQAELDAAAAPILQAAVPASEPTTLDVTLTQAELAGLALFADTSEDSEPADDAVRLLVGPGHAGYGLYASSPDYPEEGAVFIKELASPSTPEALEAAKPVAQQALDAEPKEKNHG